MAYPDDLGCGAFGDGPPCARDFILDRLSDADSPMSPVELATEYGCTNGHVRNVLMDLTEEGLVERPRRGKYVLADDGEDGEDPKHEEDDPVESSGNDTNDEDSESEAKHAAGEAHSVDLDTVGSEIDPMTALLVATVLFAVIVLVGAVLSDDVDEPAESDQAENEQEADQSDVTLIG